MITELRRQGNSGRGGEHNAKEQMDKRSHKRVNGVCVKKSHTCLEGGQLASSAVMRTICYYDE